MTSAHQSFDPAAHGRERRLPAIAVSRGIGFGKVVYLKGDERQFFRIDLRHEELGPEIERLRSAVAATTDQLKKLADNNDPDPDHPVSSIFGVHLLILSESSFVPRIEETISHRRVNAEWALKIVTDEYIALQGSVAGEHFREKHLDIEDVAARLLSALDGSSAGTELTYSGAVIAARELRPSTIMEVIKVKPAALITERGGWTSHASILAREFKLPMVSGIAPLGQVVSHGDAVIVDGVNGQLIVDPEDGTLEHFRSIAPPETDVSTSSIEPRLATTDGVEIILRANADSVSAYTLARSSGANGIGLFRSESLLGRPGTIPVEADQVAAYERIADAAGEAGVRIRTFDIGLEESGHHRASTELNPSLGLRAIRLSLVETEGFRTQIRAILRASAGKTIDMVLPMVSGIDEVIRSKEIIDTERESLIQAGTPIGSPRLGVMIELPSAVLTAPSIARHSDLLCLGTNDLVQYLLGVDRDNDAVAEWYQSLHPAVITSIASVINAADEAGIPVSVCGEMAGSPFYVPVLIGLGAHELSINPNSITQVRNLVSGISAKEAAVLVARVREMETAREIETTLREYYIEHWHELFPPGHLNARYR